MASFSWGAAAALLGAADDVRVSAVVDDSGYAELGPLLDRGVPLESSLPPVFTPA